MIGVNELEEMAADELVGLVFHQPRRGRVHVGEPALRVAGVDEILRVLDEMPQALFAGAEGFFHPHVRRIGRLRHGCSF